MPTENINFLTNLQKKISTRITANNKSSNNADNLLSSLRTQVEENITLLKKHNSSDERPTFIVNHIEENLKNKQSGNTPLISKNSTTTVSSTVGETETDLRNPTATSQTEKEKLAEEAVKIKLLDRKNIRSLEERLNKKVFGQEDVITEVVDILKVAALNIRANKSKPAGTYMFTGPSGVGKTELAVTLSESLDVPILKINMGEYGLEQDVTKLIGTSPGYVGYNEGGILTNFVSQNRKCVVLLDEIEKAHPSIDKILLSIMDHGICNDNKGNDVKFDQTIVICTSNLGANVEYIEGLTQQQKNEYRMESIKENMRPEIINRFDSIFHFHSLSKDIYEKIAVKFMNSIQENIKEEHGFDLKYSENMLNFIVEKSFDPAMGGRPARRFIEKIVIKPLADYMLVDDFETAIKAHKEVTLDINKDKNIYFKGKNRKVLGVLENTDYLISRVEQGKFTKKSKI